MEYGAIDLHARRSQIRIVTETGEVVLDRRIDTTRAALTQVFGDRAPLTILVEASTESEWVARTLEACGHQVIVADPNYTLMYGQRSRRVKTDQRDAAALAEACRLGIYRRAHRVSDSQWRERQRQTVRQRLVRQRTALINVLRAVLRQEGYRLPGGSAACVVRRVDALRLPPAVADVLAPVRASIAQVTTLLLALDRAAKKRAAADPIVVRLMTAPGVGPTVALNFRAVLDDLTRFDGDASRGAAFVGLVPREDSSGERRRLGRITKHGPGVLRGLLIQASWAIWRSRGADTTLLRAWATALAARRGKCIAIVALARRLTRMLFAMWRDGVDFQPPAARVPMM